MFSDSEDNYSFIEEIIEKISGIIRPIASLTITPSSSSDSIFREEIKYVSSPLSLKINENNGFQKSESLLSLKHPDECPIQSEPESMEPDNRKRAKSADYSFWNLDDTYRNEYEEEDIGTCRFSSIMEKKNKTI